MKRFFLLAAIMVLGIMLSAQTQTQQGYVKTKGRLDAKGNLIPGHGLKGATVSIKGRTTVLVNADNGAFSFPVPEAQFRLDSVRKKGYQLVDMDALGKIYKHSSNPLYLVMETPEQQLQDQLAAERKIRRTLTYQLHQKEDEIEALMEQKKISDDEYRLALQKLYEETDQNDQLVKDMVEHYSKIDYDQLSGFDKLISEYILNGELTKADSLIRTKGDLNQRAKEYQRHKAINAKEKEKLSQRQEQLEQSELLAQNELEGLANDCYRKFEIFKMQHLNDSAAYYLKLRARLDDSNLDWQLETGRYIIEYNAEYDEALSLFKSSLKKLTNLHENQSERASMFYSNIGIVHEKKGDYEKALYYYEKALAIETTLYDSLTPIIADSYDCIGSIYGKLDDFDKELEYELNALNIRKKVLTPFHPDIAQSYNDIGTVYSNKGDYSLALEYYERAFSIIKECLDPDYPNIATSYSNLSTTHARLGNLDKAIEYQLKAISIRKNIFGFQHPDIANSYNNLAIINRKLERYSIAKNYFDSALIIQKKVLGLNHPNLAITYNNYGGLFAHLGDFSNALDCYQKALSIREESFGSNHSATGASYHNIGDLYKKLVTILKHYIISTKR